MPLLRRRAYRWRSAYPKMVRKMKAPTLTLALAGASGASATSAQSLPVPDKRAECRRMNINACVDREQIAYENLGFVWGSYPADTRLNCSQYRNNYENLNLSAFEWDQRERILAARNGTSRFQP